METKVLYIIGSNIYDVDSGKLVSMTGEEIKNFVPGTDIDVVIDTIDTDHSLSPEDVQEMFVNNIISPFTQIKNITKDGVSFNAYMHEPKLVTTNHVKVFEDFIRQSFTHNVRYINGDMVPSGAFYKYIDIEGQRIAISDSVVGNNFLLPISLLSEKNLYVFVLDNMYMFLEEAGTNGDLYRLIEGDVISTQDDSLLMCEDTPESFTNEGIKFEFEEAHDGTSGKYYTYTKDNVKYVCPIRESMNTNLSSMMSKYIDTVNIDPQSKYLNRLHIYDIYTEGEKTKDVLNIHNNIDMTFNGLHFIHKGFRDPIYLQGKLRSTNPSTLSPDTYGVETIQGNGTLEWLKTDKFSAYQVVDKNGEPIDDAYTSKEYSNITLDEWTQLGTVVWDDVDDFEHGIKLSLNYKGEVQTEADLPNKGIVGDTYKVIETGKEMFWNSVSFVEVPEHKGHKYADFDVDVLWRPVNDVSLSNDPIKMNTIIKGCGQDDFMMSFYKEGVNIYCNAYLKSSTDNYIDEQLKSQHLCDIITNGRIITKQEDAIILTSDPIYVPIKQWLASDKGDKAFEDLKNSLSEIDDFVSITRNGDRFILSIKNVYETKVSVSYKYQYCKYDKLSLTWKPVDPSVYDMNDERLDIMTTFFYHPVVQVKNDLVDYEKDDQKKVNGEWIIPGGDYYGGDLKLIHDTGYVLYDTSLKTTVPDSQPALYWWDMSDEDIASQIRSGSFTFTPETLRLYWGIDGNTEVTKNYLIRDLTGTVATYRISYTSSDDYIGIAVKVVDADGTEHVYTGNGTTFETTGTEKLVVAYIYANVDISDGYVDFGNSNAHWIDPHIEVVETTMDPLLYDWRQETYDNENDVVSLTSNGVTYRYGKTNSKDAIKLYQEFFRCTLMICYVENNKQIGRTWKVFQGVPSVPSGTFDYDFYLMHDNERWYGVFISQDTIDKARRSQDLDAGDEEIIVNGHSNDYHLKLSRSGNEFLVNRMTYIPSNGNNTFMDDDIIVATLGNNDRLPVDVMSGSKWTIKGMSIGMDKDYTTTSNHEMVIISSGSKTNSLGKGFYNVGVSYSVDNDIQTQQTDIAKFKVLKNS